MESLEGELPTGLESEAKEENGEGMMVNAPIPLGRWRHCAMDVFSRAR